MNFKNIIFFLWMLCIIFGCSLDENTVQPEIAGVSLKVLKQYNLNVPEPSGLAFHIDKKTLWTVSDQTGNVYKINLSGQVLETLEVRADDLEGIFFHRGTQSLLVVEENLANVLWIDTLGIAGNRYEILRTHDNSGLEGICADKEGNIFVLKEKAPGLWIALNSDFSIEEQKELKFAPDYSDITPDTTLNRFWILSDQAKQLFLWDKNDGVIEKYNVPVENPEGIAIDFVNQIFYIVSDSQQKLFILSQ